MKELGRRYQNTHNKRSLIRTSHICQRRRGAGRNQQMDEYKHTNTHTHTHIHTHTHTHTHRGVNFQETEETYKIWRGIDLPFQNWHKQFDTF